MIAAFLLALTIAAAGCAAACGGCCVAIGRHADVPDGVAFALGCLLGAVGVGVLYVAVRRQRTADAIEPMGDW